MTFEITVYIMIAIEAQGLSVLRFSLPKGVKDAKKGNLAEAEIFREILL